MNWLFIVILVIVGLIVSFELGYNTAEEDYRDFAAMRHFEKKAELKMAYVRGYEDGRKSIRCAVKRKSIK